MPKGYIDCHKCKCSHRLYDHTGKWTGAVFCSMRNGKIRKRFRGECEWEEREDKHDCVDKNRDQCTHEPPAPGV